MRATSAPTTVDATGPRTPRVGLASSLTICSALAIGATLVVMPLLRLSLPGQTLPPPFLSQHQDAENLIFIFAFLIALPTGTVVGCRLVDRIIRGSRTNDVRAAAALLAGSLLGCVVVLRILSYASPGHSLAVQIPLMSAWLAIAIAGLLELGSARPTMEWLRRVPSRLPLSAALVTGVAAVLAFVDLNSVSWLALSLGAAAVFAADRLAVRTVRPSLAPRYGRAIDFAFIVVLVFAVPNLRIFDPSDPFINQIIQFHQNFFIGPAERVLAGNPVLDGTVSQYGVGSILLVAGWFDIVPASNYTLGLLEGLLSAAMFASAYLVMRIAGVQRLIAIIAMVVGLLACVFALKYPLGGLLQHGAIRFGLPVGAIVGAVVAERWRRRRTGIAIQLLVLAIASIWALEAFVYTLFTVIAIVAVQAFLEPDGHRVRWATRRLALLAISILVAQVTFALAMLAATGDLPNWGSYLTTLKAFLTGPVGELTYDFEPFSPGLAIGAAYLVSAIALVLTVWEVGQGIRTCDRVKLIAVTGATAWGVALFSYFVNRSAGHILPYICLPALVTGAIWLSIAIDAYRDPRAPARRLAIAAAGSLAVLIVAVAFSTGLSRFSDSALAIAAPGGESLQSALKRIWDPPPVAPGAQQAERLLEQYMPGQERSLVLTSADLGVEVLARTGRANVLPFGDPWEDSFVPSNHIDAIRHAVADLRAGDLALIDAPGLKAFAGYRREPQRDPLTDAFGAEAIVPTGVSALQELALKEIGERFRLKRVAGDPSGVEVVELESRDG